MKKKIILNPNCSEQVFRLTGTLDDIKRSIIEMLNVISREFKGEGDLDDFNKKRIKEKKKEIRAVKDIEELYHIVIPFTINYETFFKPDGDDLLVATCNNHEWRGFHYIDEDSESYYAISGHHHYDIVAVDKDWIVIKKEICDENGNITRTIYVPLEPDCNINLKRFNFNPDLGEKGKEWDTASLREMDNDTYVHYYGEIKTIFKRVMDKKKLERMNEIVMVEIL